MSQEPDQYGRTGLDSIAGGISQVLQEAGNAISGGKQAREHGARENTRIANLNIKLAADQLAERNRKQQQDIKASQVAGAAQNKPVETKVSTSSSQSVTAENISKPTLQTKLTPTKPDLSKDFLGL